MADESYKKPVWSWLTPTLLSLILVLILAGYNAMAADVEGKLDVIVFEAKQETMKIQLDDIKEDVSEIKEDQKEILDILRERR